MRLVSWVIVCVVAFAVGAWCFFAGVMTAALATGPTTAEQLAGLRASSNRLLLLSAVFVCLVVFSLVRMVLLMCRMKASAAINDAVQFRKGE